MKGRTLKQFLLTILLLLPVMLDAQNLPVVFAHRGCWLENEVPENSVEAVAMAKRYGYPAIECDVHYTKDSVMVIMHDFRNMKRCIRKRKDYARLDSVLGTADITYEDLKRDYVLASKNMAYRVPVPTLEEILTACKEHGIKPILHSNEVESYHMAQRMFGNDWIAFSGKDSALTEARRISDCMILMSRNNATADSTIRAMRALGGKVGLSSMNYEMYTREFCDSIRQAGFDVQASIFPTPYEAHAVANGASILLSNYVYMPNTGKKPYGKKKTGRHLFIIGEGTSIEADKETEFGASVLQVTFKGTLSVKFNDKLTYTFHHADWGTDIFGVRHFKKKPKVDIMSLETSEIKSATLSFYEF